MSICKFSVIVPTMWRPPGFHAFLCRLCESPDVDEVIIIDNAPKAAPPDPLDLSHEKIVRLRQEKNIFVNPAWNLGVSVSRNEKLCLLNDDLEFDLGAFGYVSRCMESCGLIGLDVKRPGGTFRLVPTTTRPFGFGTMMFLEKSHYVPVPRFLKVWCGDDYLFQSNQLKGRTNYVLAGAGHNVQQSVSVTASTIPRKMLRREKQLYRWVALLGLGMRHPLRMMRLRDYSRGGRWRTRLGASGKG
jgi:hypothetical protein